MRKENLIASPDYHRLPAKVFTGFTDQRAPQAGRQAGRQAGWLAGWLAGWPAGSLGGELQIAVTCLSLPTGGKK